MSIFEFVLTGVTLVLALVVTRLLGGLRWALDRRRAYWVHSLLVLVMLTLTTLIWWGLWYVRDTDWTYLSFAYNLLVGPGILYFATTVLVPDNPRRVRSWREHYYKVRQMFYGSFAMVVVLLVLGSVLYAQTPLWHFTRLLQAMALGICAIGYYSDQHRVHAALAVLLAALVVAAAGYSEYASRGL